MLWLLGHQPTAVEWASCQSRWAERGPEFWAGMAKRLTCWLTEEEKVLKDNWCRKKAVDYKEKDQDFLESCVLCFLRSLRSTGVKEFKLGFGFFSTYSCGPRSLRSLLCGDRMSLSTHCQVSWMKRTFSSCAGVKSSPLFVGDRGLEVRLQLFTILGADELILCVVCLLLLSNDFFLGGGG